MARTLVDTTAGPLTYEAERPQAQISSGRGDGPNTSPIPVARTLGRQSVWGATLATFSSITVACGAERVEVRDTRPEGSITSASPLRVTLTLPQDSTPLIRKITEDLRIGATDGDGQDVVTIITGLAVGAAGSIFVLDYGSDEIRVFDPTGAFKFKFGRSGGGPGELKSAYGMRWSPTGTLRVLDRGNARYSEFKSNGEFLRSHRMDFVIRDFWNGGFDREGRVCDEVLHGGSEGVLSALVAASRWIGTDLDQADPIPVRLR